MPNAQSLISLLLAYLLGSIPFGLILTRLAGLGDIRAVGSGNIGATNVLRTGNKKLAALVLLLDGAKGFAAVWIANADYMFAAGLLAVLGHIFPIWLKFKGGKGVATAIGAILGINPLIGLSVIVTWLIIFTITRISSLSALLGFALNCITTAIAGQKSEFLLMASLTLLLCYTHRANIRRLIVGTEPRFGKQS